MSSFCRDSWDTELIRIHPSDTDVAWSRYWSHSWSLIRERCSVVSTFNSYGLPLGLSTKSSPNAFEVKWWSSDEKESRNIINTWSRQAKPRKEHGSGSPKYSIIKLKGGIMAEDFDEDSVDHVWFFSDTSPPDLVTPMCGAWLSSEIPSPSCTLCISCLPLSGLFSHIDEAHPLVAS